MKNSIYYKENLTIVVGKHSSDYINHFSIENNESLIGNLNYDISSELLGVSKQERAKSIINIFTNLVMKNDSSVVYLLNIEILFDRSLNIDTLKLLKSVAKNKVLVVLWPGDKNTDSLSYAEPSHPEYRLYKSSDLSEITFIDTDKNSQEEL